MKNLILSLILSVSLLSCVKDHLQPPPTVPPGNGVADKCGTITKVVGKDVSNPASPIFLVEYTITVSWSDGTSSEVGNAPSTSEVGQKYCR